MDRISEILRDVTGGDMATVDVFRPRLPAEHETWLRQQASELAKSQHHAEARLKASGCPPVLAGLVARGEVTETASVQAVRAWQRSRERGLVLRGGVGCGKSFAAAVAMHAAGSGSWHRPRAFVSGVLHAYDERSPRVAERFVVVDDVGSERAGDDLGEALCAFIDDAEARFVLTTNLGRDAFRERYDVRVIDRLNSCARALDIPGASRRRQGGGF